MIPGISGIMAGIGGLSDPYANVKKFPALQSARYIYLETASVSSNVASASEIQFRASLGGASINGAGTYVGTFTDGANSYDGNNSTFGFGSPDGARTGLDLGVGNSGTPAAISWRNRPSGTAGELQQAFRSGWIMLSDDNITFRKSSSIWTDNVWDTAGETAVFGVPANGLLLDVRAANTTEQVGGGTFTLNNGATRNAGTGWFEFDGVNDFLSFPVNSQIGIKGDWTIEFHTDGLSASDEGAIFQIGGLLGFFVYAGGGGGMDLFSNGQALSTGAGAVNGGPQHWAFVKRNGIWKGYVSGVNDPLGDDILTEEISPAYGGTARIGMDTANRAVACKVGRFLIWDHARYTGNFPAPAVTDIPLYEP